MNNAVFQADSLLPEQWTSMRLGDVTLKIADRDHYTPTYVESGVLMVSPKDFDEDGRINFSTCQFISAKEHERNRRKTDITAGDLVFTRIGARLGKACLVTPAMPEFSLLHSAVMIRTATEKVLPEFLVYVLKGHQLQSQIGREIQSIGVPDLGLDKISDFVISLPPLNQQHKIARILTTLDNLIEKTEALIAKYQAIKQGLMHDLFTRGIDEHGHLRPPHAEAPHLYKRSELGWIPKEWEVVRVDSVGSAQLGRQRSPKHQSGRFSMPYFRVANIFDGWIDYSDILQMDFTPSERESYSVLPGDIFLNEGQSLELVGRCAVYEGEPGRYCFQNTLVRFRIYPPNNYHFCRGVFKHWLDTGRFTTVARQTTSVAHLGADRFAGMFFPLPSSEEQTKIATHLEQLNRFVWSNEKHLDKLRATKCGLMQDLLTGRVRVQVDDREEVAANA